MNSNYVLKTLIFFGILSPCDYIKTGRLINSTVVTQNQTDSNFMGAGSLGIALGSRQSFFEIIIANGTLLTTADPGT
jgi:hypothetical protein